MLTQSEQAGIKTILAILSDENVQSLATTVTKGHIAVANRTECEQAILAFVESGEDFLHRRACSKAILIQYAYEEGLAVSSNIYREELITLIHDHWSTEKGLQRASGESEPSSGALANGGVTIINNYSLNINVQHTNVQHNNNSVGDLDHQFGEQFAHWFFDTLNHVDPVSQGFGPTSFLPGVMLQTSHITPGCENKNVVKECDNVANYFLELFCQFRLLPNYSGNGLRTKSDPHGLMMVLVCGTLYKVSSLRGVFEQSFGLVQDPHNPQNWKIQFSELRLKETSRKETPQLEDFCDIPELEANTIRSLEIALRN